MGISELTTAVDKYLSTHVVDRPRAYAIGTTGPQYANNAPGASGSVGKVPPPRPPPPRVLAIQVLDKDKWGLLFPRGM